MKNIFEQQIDACNRDRERLIELRDFMTSFLHSIDAAARDEKDYNRSRFLDTLKAETRAAYQHTAGALLAAKHPSDANVS